MSKLFLFVCLLFSLSFNGSKSDVEKNKYADFFDENWAKNSLWNDGKYEFATYDISRLNETSIQRSHLYAMLSKEQFDQKTNTVTQDSSSKSAVRLFKYHWITNNYSENVGTQTASSVFVVENEIQQLYKQLASKQDSCGIVFGTIELQNKHYVAELNSYQDSVGKKIQAFERDILFEDQLMFSLRCLKFKPELNLTVPVMSTFFPMGKDYFKLNQAEIHVQKAKLPAYFRTEGISYAWKVSVSLEANRVNDYWFNMDYPNTLLMMNTWEGLRWNLIGLERRSR